MMLLCRNACLSYRDACLLFLDPEQMHGAGCANNETSPQQGDVRLVQLDGISAITDTCDDVHFGGVELFNDGEWGRVCKSITSESSIVNAKVVCRQLGFQFSSLMGVEEVSNAAYDYRTSDSIPSIVWATEVRCTGKEERLADCNFPEEFGNASVRTADQTPPPSARPGVSDGICGQVDEEVLGVVCRRFELEGGSHASAAVPSSFKCGRLRYTSAPRRDAC